MYMYKTNISWSVWEGEHLGVSTFLTNCIKCTQGWIFYVFGFFFRTTPYSALDFWTWKITTSFMKYTSHKTTVDTKRVLSLAGPCSSGCCCPASPFLQIQLGEGWSQKPEVSPQNSQTCLDLTAGAVGSFSCCFQEPSHCISPMIRPQWEILMSAFSRREFIFNAKYHLCVKISLKHPWAWVVRKALTKYLNYV